MNDILAEEYGVSAPLLKKAAETEEKCAEVFKQIDKVKEYNQLRVLHAFMEERVSPSHFAPSYGYGYDDAGREKLEQLFARIFKAEAALVRPHIASGTHAGLQLYQTFVLYYGGNRSSCQTATSCTAT